MVHHTISSSRLPLQLLQEEHQYVSSSATVSFSQPLYFTLCCFATGNTPEDLKNFFVNMFTAWQTDGN